PGKPVVLRLVKARRGAPSESAGMSSPTTSDEKSTLRVRVLDASGRPVASASIRLHRGNDTSGTYVRSGDARFDRFDPTGDATLYVWDARGESGEPLGLAAAHQRVPVGATSVEVRLVAESVVEGTVLGADGKGIAGAF